MTYEEAKAREQELVERAQGMMRGVCEEDTSLLRFQIKCIVEDAFTAGEKWQRAEGLKEIKRVIAQQYRR